MKTERVQKKIWLNEAKTKWCICVVFKNKADMQKAYKQIRPLEKGHEEVDGVSIHYGRYDGNKLSGNTGKVLLHFKGCGVAVATHEILHAVLYAYKHTKNKQQYPIVIKDMKEEEVILHNYSFSAYQFYTWYYKKIEPKFK